MSDGRIERPVEGTEKPVSYAEVIRLIRYAAERGMDPEGKIIGPLYRAVEIYNMPGEGLSLDEKRQADEETLVLYGKLTELTYAGVSADSKGVSGRTLLDTEFKYKWYSYKILCWGLLFLVLAVGTASVDLWVSKNSSASDGRLAYLYYLHIYFLDSFSPFWWGALGACVFLMKRLSDRAAELCFDSRRWNGWGTRIMLGGLLGLIFAYIYNPKGGLDSTHLNFDTNAIAFFTGVGVRVFYGGIEKLIDVIAEKFNLGKGKDKRIFSDQPSDTN